MPQDDFYQFQNEAIRLYNDNRLDEAFDYVRAGAGQFPDERAQTVNWLASIRARQGRPEDALRLLETALDEGVWWSETSLLEDPDLEPLHCLTGYKEMVQKSAALHAQAQAESRPSLLVLSPAKTASAARIAAVMHGRQSSVRLHVPFWSSLTQQGYRLAMLQSSQLSGMNLYEWDQTGQAVADVRQHFATLEDDYNAMLGEVILGGFSQGAGLAIRLALSTAVPAQRFIAVAPFLPDAAELAQSLPAKAQAGTRGYIVLGEADPLTGNFEAVAGLLRSRGVPFEVERHAGLGHMYPEDFEHSLEQALAYLNEGRPAAGKKG